MRGYFKEERFFIRRERGGKNGYLVFAPFVTALRKPMAPGNESINPPYEHSIWVNLGWVPSENKEDITMGNDPVPLLELSEKPTDNF